MDPSELAQLREIAAKILRDASEDQKQKLRTWLDRLLEIQRDKTSKVAKVRAAVAVTYKSRTIWQLIKLIAAEAKKYGWDKAGPKTRWAQVGAVAGVVLFGGQGVGIAALGGAIGIPIWVVLGGGAVFAKIFIDESARASVKPDTPIAKTESSTKSGDINEKAL